MRECGFSPETFLKDSYKDSIKNSVPAIFFYTDFKRAFTNVDTKYNIV